MSATSAPHRFVLRSRMFFSVVCVAFFAATGTGWGQGFDLPPIPEDRGFVQDYAGLLSPSDRERLGEIQRVAFRENDTPIVVVTINNQAGYGGGSRSIDEFAAEWFNHWQIGKRDEDGELINRGILVLVSVGDRTARIELGADWGRAWDRHCTRIMDKRMVPEFARGNYGAGLIAGLDGLAEMAAMGPDASPPGGLGPLIERLEERPFESSPLPLWGIGLMVVGGVGLIGWYIVGRPEELFLTERGGSILLVGIALLVGAFFFWFVLAGAAVLLRIFGGRGGGSSGGFSSSGGFGGGGFSGGGGASGSW